MSNALRKSNSPFPLSSSILCFKIYRSTFSGKCLVQLQTSAIPIANTYIDVNRYFLLYIFIATSYCFSLMSLFVLRCCVTIEINEIYLIEKNLTIAIFHQSHHRLLEFDLHRIGICTFSIIVLTLW